MRLLKNQQNVDAPSTDFPYARIRDNPGNATGTPFDEALYGDPQQFFARLFDKSGLVANGIADGNYAGWQLFEALLLACKPYRVYSAEIFQSSTSNPSALVMRNELSAAIVWARSSTGVYTGTLTGAFTVSQTLLFNATTVNGNIKLTHTSANVISINTIAGGVAADGVLDNIAIEIRVYQ